MPFKLASGALVLNGDYRFTLDPFGLEATLPTIAVRDLRLAERANSASVPIVIPEIDTDGDEAGIAQRQPLLTDLR